MRWSGRNAVLALMRDDKFIGDRDYCRCQRIAAQSRERAVGIERRTLFCGPESTMNWNRRFPDHDFQEFRPHATPRLPESAACGQRGVSIGIKLVDDR